MDFIFAFFIIIPLLPLFLLIILFYFLNGVSNFLFLQKRIGRHNHEFIIYKFKTYKTDLSSQKSLDERKYWFTDILRRTSIDELPQLINILKGEMSFVGPRPLLPEYLNLYSERQRKRHQVKPGITGLAQVNADKVKNWEKRLEYDVQYVENLSFLLDLKIIRKTIELILSKRNLQDLDKPFQGNE